MIIVFKDNRALLISYTKAQIGRQMPEWFLKKPICSGLTAGQDFLQDHKPLLDGQRCIKSFRYFIDKASACKTEDTIKSKIKRKLPVLYFFQIIERIPAGLFQEKLLVWKIRIYNGLQQGFCKKRSKACFRLDDYSIISIFCIKQHIKEITGIFW